MENTKRNWKPIIIIVLFMVGNAIVDFVVCDEPLFFTLHLWCLIPYFCLIMYVATKSSLNIIYWIFGDIVYCFLGSIKYLSIGEASLETMILWTVFVFIFQVVVLLTIMIIRKRMSPLKIKETKKIIIIVVMFMVAKYIVDFFAIPLILYGADFMGLMGSEFTSEVCLLLPPYVIAFAYLMLYISKKSTSNFFIWLLGDIVYFFLFYIIYDKVVGIYYPGLDFLDDYSIGGTKSLLWPAPHYTGFFDGIADVVNIFLWLFLIPIIQAITLLIATIERKCHV